MLVTSHLYIYFVSVSAIKVLCDHNGYRIAEDYRVGSVLSDHSVVLAITDHRDDMTCSQGVVGYVKKFGKFVLSSIFQSTALVNMVLILAQVKGYKTQQYICLSYL